MPGTTGYNVLKFLHIVSAIMFVGGIFARQIVRRYATAATDLPRLTTLYEAAIDVENWMVKPASFVILGLGIALAWRGGIPMLGVLQGEKQNWLLVSNLLFLTGFALVPAVFVPSGRRFRTALEAARREGRITTRLRDAMNDPIVKVAHVYEILALLTIVALMTLEPF